MLKKLTISQIYVLDQDKALDFYVGKLGLEVKTDADLGFMRWLTVGLPGDDREILLEKPGAPVMDEASAAQVRDLLTKGRTGGHLFHRQLPQDVRRAEGQGCRVLRRAHRASVRDRRRIAGPVRQSHPLLAAHVPPVSERAPGLALRVDHDLRQCADTCGGPPCS